MVRSICLGLLAILVVGVFVSLTNPHLATVKVLVLPESDAFIKNEQHFDLAFCYQYYGLARLPFFIDTQSAYFAWQLAETAQVIPLERYELVIFLAQHDFDIAQETYFLPYHYYSLLFWLAFLSTLIILPLKMAVDDRRQHKPVVHMPKIGVKSKKAEEPKVYLGYLHRPSHFSLWAQIKNFFKSFKKP